MKATCQCSHCGAHDRKVYLHHGKLYCGMCLRTDKDDDLFVRAKITLIRVEETRELLRKRRERK